MTAKPPHNTPTPAGAATNGAGAAAAGAASAAVGAATSGGGGIVGWWTSLTQQHMPQVQKSVGNAVKHMQKQKFVMPVDVKVDFLRPTFQALEESATAVWTQLPPPVQQAAPYVGVGLGAGLVVYAIQQRRVNHQRQRGDKLQEEVHVLHKEKAELLKRINALRVKAGSPRTEVEARMAAAVAEATNAAAAAADAAARAATACIYQRPPPSAAGAGGGGFPPGLAAP